MYIASKLKEQSVSEYLLYMWQVEDTIRAYGLDADRLAAEYVPMFKLDEARSAELAGWYESLIRMMKEEGVTESGHLQINNNILLLLTDLHQALLKDTKQPFYSAAYYKALPFIVEIRAKSESTREKGELENCFDALYAVMLLRAQGKPVGKETADAIGSIAQFVGMLSEYYKKDKAGELKLS